jgi:hypothetical protein
MEACLMVTGVDEKMRLWREGCLSDSEIMLWLIHAMAEVQMTMSANEEAIAEKRMASLG